MGSFSWTRSEHTTNRANISYKDTYKILVPKEFGGGFIEDVYYDYGEVFHYDEDKATADLYGILAYWNGCEDMKYDGDSYPKTMQEILERGNTALQENRVRGIKIGCHTADINKLRYPLKLVSLSYKGTYEDCAGKSYLDPEQGCGHQTWRRQRYSQILKALRRMESQKKQTKN